MPVPSLITDLSTTAGSNSPAGTESIGTNADDYIRALASFIAALRDGSKNIALGSAGAPAIAFTGDSNTGIFSPGADQVGIAAGGTAVVVVSATTATINSINIGYRPIPSLATSGGTAAAEVLGKAYATTGNIEVPANVFAAGDAFSVYNNSANPVTVTQGSGATLRLGGTTSTGNRTLAARGMATVWYVSATEAVITGAGVS